MKIAKLYVERIEQETQEVGGTGGHMRSRVFFRYEYDGKVTEELSSIIKQTSGTDFSSHPLEVSMPDNYEGPFNYAAFRDAVEHYYRSSVATSSVPLGSSARVTMSNNVFSQVRMYEIPINPQ